MNQTLKKKFLNILVSALYFATAITICVTVSSLINKSYFEFIYVSGGSMSPTLMGGHSSKATGPSYNAVTGEYTPGDTVHFGKIDTSTKAKKNIQRYDIVTTYYPYPYDNDYNADGVLLDSADYKIKRVIALPGDTFKIVLGILYLKVDDEFVPVERTYLIDDGGNPSVADVTERTLKENEYWVMGDHRSASWDCADFKVPVTFDNIVGVVVSIEGTAEFYYHYKCATCGREVNDTDYLMGKIEKCSKCEGDIIKGKSDIRNRQYTYPKVL